MPEIRIESTAKKDLKRIGPAPERNRIVAGLRRLADAAIERIVPRGAFDAAAVSLPEQH